MADSSKVDDEYSGAWRQNIDNIDEWGLLSCEANQPDYVDEDTNPIADEDKEVESEDIYVGRTFGDENEAYDAYNSYVLAKGFGVRKGRISKSRTDQKVIRRQFLCKKEGRQKSR